MNTVDYKRVSIEKTYSELNTTIKGLSNSEVEARQKQFGYNEVAEKQKSALSVLLSHFWNPMSAMLTIAAIFAYLLSDVSDAIIIFALVIINGTVCFFEERNSQNALELLKKKLTIKSKVLRDNIWNTLSSRELVPGDIIIVGLGDVIPADAKIISGDLSVDQSAITGESLAVELKSNSILYTGSVVKRGEAKCVVINTAMHTFYGKTVQLVNIAKPKSKQQEIMLKISNYMVYLGIVAFIIILLYSTFVQSVSIEILVTFAILFILGGVPAILPIMFTIAQSAGSMELAKKGILVTKLDAIENAASVEVLCLDKTGTITMNELNIKDLIPFSGTSKDELAIASVLASNAESKDLIDSTVINYAKSKQINYVGYKQVSFKPFEPSTKRTEAVIEYKGKRFTVTKGAPQIIIGLCSLSKSEINSINKQIDEFSKKGYRIIAVAKSKNKELEFLGFLILSDPLRPDSARMIANMVAAGVRPFLITGDSLSVAKEIAKQAGIGGNILKMSDLKGLTPEEIEKVGKTCNGLAEIYPEDKYRIVKFLQSKGLTVGMTGDGVNDAPSLKQAEMGIAVSNAMDVAKAAASLVLIEPGTEVILEAIKTSRKIYQRMLTWTLNKVTKSIQFILTLTVGFFWFHDLMVSLTALIALLVVNDVMTMSLATDNARSTTSPNKWNVKNITLAAIFLGILFFAESMLSLVIGVKYFNLDIPALKTVTLMSLVYTSQLRVWMIRERGHFWDSLPSWGVILTTIVTMIAFSLFAVYGVVMDKLPANVLAVMFALAFVFVLLIEFPKYWIFKRYGL